MDLHLELHCYGANGKPGRVRWAGIGKKAAKGLWYVLLSLDFTAFVILLANRYKRGLFTYQAYQLSQNTLCALSITPQLTYSKEFSSKHS